MEHHALEDIGYAIETMELARAILAPRLGVLPPQKGDLKIIVSPSFLFFRKFFAPPVISIDHYNPETPETPLKHHLDLPFLIEEKNEK